MDNKKVKIEFVGGAKKLHKEFYVRSVALSLRKLDKLFPASPAAITVRIFEKRNSFLNAIGKKTAPDWLIAYVPKGNASRIYLLNDAKTSAAKSVKRQVLLHELTHLYTNALNQNLPDWLKEGISVYVASQIFKPSIAISEWNMIAPRGFPFKGISWRFAAEHNGYTIAGLLVVFLVRKYGWKNFIAAISHGNPMPSPIKNIPRFFDRDPKQLIADFKEQFVKNH